MCVAMVVNGLEISSGYSPLLRPKQHLNQSRGDVGVGGHRSWRDLVSCMCMSVMVVSVLMLHSERGYAESNAREEVG